MILYRTSATAPWTAITHYSNDIPTWTLDSLFLPYPTNTYQIAFQGTVRYGYGIFLDDVTVTGDAIVEPDTCTAVSMLTVSEVGIDYVTLDWARIRLLGCRLSGSGYVRLGYDAYDCQTFHY